jgi:hypothetical protein
VELLGQVIALLTVECFFNYKHRDDTRKKKHRGDAISEDMIFFQRWKAA